MMASFRRLQKGSHIATPVILSSVIQCHGVFGNPFSEIHAPQNLDIESKLKALCLLVSEIDVLLCKWRPFCINGLQNGGYNGMVYSAILFLKSTPQKTYI